MMKLAVLRQTALRILPSPLLQALYGMLRSLRGLKSKPIVCCLVAIEDQEGRILLVRHSYRWPEQWMLVGGNLLAEENPIAAARREAFEEVGCTLKYPTLQEYHDWDDIRPSMQVYVITALTDDIPAPRDGEIKEARFFNPEDLPSSVDQLVQWQVPALIERSSFAFHVPPYIRPGFLSELPARYPRDLT